MREQISLMLQKNTISEIPPDTPGFYSNVFLVRKASGGWRQVIDLKQLNAHIAAPHFHMHTHYKLSAEYHQKLGGYSFKKDLQDAYFHVLIHPDSRKYLCFAFENKVYQFRVLTFGLNTSPQIITRLGHTVAAYLHNKRCLRIVAKGYRLRYTSPPLLLLDPWEIRSPKADSRNARTNIPNASKEYNLRNTSGYSRILFKCVPGTQGFWRVASSNRFKTTECPHRRTSLSHAHTL